MTTYAGESGGLTDGPVWSQQFAAALYVERMVAQPGYSHRRPREARFDASLPRSGAPN